MSFFPIVIRELLVAARKIGTYRSRFLSSMAGLVISLLVVFSMEGRGVSSAAQGRFLFSALSILGLAYALVVGVRATADCLSVEKRDGTLGLLFLTDLTGMDVVMGKLAATSLRSIYGLIALIPILAIPLQMGGVTGLTFFQVVLSLLNALFLSLTAGMFVSALSYHDRKAMSAAVLIIATIAAGPFAMWVYVETLEGSVSFVLRLLVWLSLSVSPISPFLIADSGRLLGVNIGQFFPQAGAYVGLIFATTLIVSHTLAWVLLVSASRLLVSFVRQERRVRWFESAQRWLNRLVYGNESDRRAHRRKYLDLNAFSWLTSRERLKTKYVWIFVGSVVVIYAWNLTTQGDVMFDDRSLIPLGFLIHAFLKIWIASEACYRIAEDRRIGALELLLSTPLGPGEIVRGQVLAIWRQFGMAVIFLVGMELFLIFGWATEARDGQGFQTRAIYLGAVFILLMDAASIVWAAMWNGVRQGSANRAIAQTVGGFLVIPWVLYMIALPCWEGLQQLLAANGVIVVDFSWTGFDGLLFRFRWESVDTAQRVMLWVVVGVLFDIKVGWMAARRALLTQFRTRVSDWQRVSENEAG